VLILDNSIQVRGSLATQGEKALAGTAATKKFCAQMRKVRNAIDWQSAPWWLGRIAEVV
jgi:hypothetical protein